MSSTTATHAPQNHIFVDVENMKSINPVVLGLKHLVIHLFLGPQDKKLEVEVVEVILTNSHGIRLVRSPKNGKNALDFVLAYHLGQAAMAEPKAYFHILSKDCGFDSLVELLRSKQIKACRYANWDTLHAALTHKPPAHKSLTPPAAPTIKPLSPGAEKVLNYLKKSPNNRPKKYTNLVRQAQSYLGKDATDAMAESVVQELRCSKKISIEEKGGLTYHFV
jgi:PIN domain